MALPFIASLTPRVRRLLPIIKAGVYRNISSRNINDLIRKVEGTGIKRQVLLDTMRALRGVKDAGRHLRNVPRNAIPNIRRLPEAVTKMRTAVTFIVRVLGTSTVTGQETEQWVSLGMAKPVSRSQLEAMAIARVEKRQEKYEMIELIAQLREGTRAGPLGIL